MKKYYLILLLIGLFQGNIKEYSISLYGIPMADIMIEIQDTVYHDNNAVKLLYTTKTNKITSTLFKVDNMYETIIDKNTLKIISFKKSTFQPNVTNRLYTTYTNDEVRYNDSNTIIPDNCFNIFSLLYYLSNNPFNSIQNIVTVEREGLIYNCKISKFQINQKLEFNLEFNLINNKNNAIIEHTDIFTWALFKKGGYNKLIINGSKIESCHFKSGLTNLKANIKKEGSP